MSKKILSRDEQMARLEGKISDLVKRSSEAHDRWARAHKYYSEAKDGTTAVALYRAFDGEKASRRELQVNRELDAARAEWDRLAAE